MCSSRLAGAAHRRSLCETVKNTLDCHLLLYLSDHNHLATLINTLPVLKVTVYAAQQVTQQKMIVRAFFTVTRIRKNAFS